MIRGLLLAVLLLATGTHAWAEALGTDTDTNAHPDIVIIKCADGVTTVSGHACGPNNPLATSRYDIRASGTLNAATANAAVTVGLNNGEGVVAFQITGVAASGAVLTPEASADGGTTWLPVSVESAGAALSTIAADGTVRLPAAGYTNVRLRVSTVGTGTVTIASNASSVSVDPAVRTALNTIAANTAAAAAAAAAFQGAISVTPGTTVTAGRSIGYVCPTASGTVTFTFPDGSTLPVYLTASASIQTLPFAVTFVAIGTEAAACTFTNLK